MNVFSRNWVIKLYYSLMLIALITIIIKEDTDYIGWLVFLLLAFVLYGIVRVFTDKVIVQGNKVTTKTLLGEKSIVITPYSFIYIKRQSYSFNFVLRINNYSIRIENSADEVLKINADVQDADELFELIQNIEHNRVTPKVIEIFNEHHAIQMKNSIYIDLEGFRIGGKSFKYEEIKGVRIKEGNLVVMGTGRMWDRALLTKPISDIPNFATNLTILGQFTSVA